MHGKFHLPRESYLPRESAGALNITSETIGNIVIYRYVTALDKPAAMAFQGKKAKPDWHYLYSSKEARERKITAYLAAIQEQDNVKTRRKAERAKPHTLNVGDILSSMWGYDQTNVDYYQVTRVIGPNSVEICKIAAHSGPEDGFMTAVCTATKDKFIGKPLVKRASADNCVKITSFSYASPWDGKPDRYSWYA